MYPNNGSQLNLSLKAGESLEFEIKGTTQNNNRGGRFMAQCSAAAASK